MFVLGPGVPGVTRRTPADPGINAGVRRGCTLTNLPAAALTLAPRLATCGRSRLARIARRCFGRTAIGRVCARGSRRRAAATRDLRPLAPTGAARGGDE